MNIDIRLSLDFFDHPKTKKLIKRCGMEGVTSLIKLWMWTAQRKPSGVLDGLDGEAIELVADWTGEDGDFFDQLVTLHWLDEKDGVYSIHAWQENQAYACKSEERSEKARKASKSRWDRCKQSCDDASVCSEDASSIAKSCLDDASTMPQASFSNAPETRNQKPETKKEERVSETAEPSRTPAPEKAFPSELTDFVRKFQFAVAVRFKALAPKMTDKLLHDGADALDKCVRIDGLDLDEVKLAAMWAVNDDFWGSNLRSLAQMRTVGKNGSSKIQNVIGDYRKWQSSAKPKKTTTLVRRPL